MVFPLIENARAWAGAATIIKRISEQKRMILHCVFGFGVFFIFNRNLSFDILNLGISKSWAAALR